MFCCGRTTTNFSLNTHFCCHYICSNAAAMEWISVSCGKSIKCVYEGSSLYLSPFNFTWFFFPFILLLFSGSPCCTWTATSVWTCRQKKTSWFPPSETATTAAPSSGCSVTWPWASDPPSAPLPSLALHTITRWTWPCATYICFCISLNRIQGSTSQLVTLHRVVVSIHNCSVRPSGCGLWDNFSMKNVCTEKKTLQSASVAQAVV